MLIAVWKSQLSSGEASTRRKDMKQQHCANSLFHNQLD